MESNKGKYPPQNTGVSPIGHANSSARTHSESVSFSFVFSCFDLTKQVHHLLPLYASFPRAISTLLVSVPYDSTRTKCAGHCRQQDGTRLAGSGSLHFLSLLIPFPIVKVSLEIAGKFGV
jgi:hypothetical protein